MILINLSWCGGWSIGYTYPQNIPPLRFLFHPTAGIYTIYIQHPAKHIYTIKNALIWLPVCFCRLFQCFDPSLLPYFLCNNGQKQAISLNFEYLMIRDHKLLDHMESLKSNTA